MGAKEASAADLEIGERIRAVRLARRVSQSALADQLGVTFQQLQKYEKGSNRISASRLLKAAAFLEIDLAVLATGQAAAGYFEWEFASRSRATAELAQLWNRLSPGVQEAILTFARAAAAEKVK